MSDHQDVVSYHKSLVSYHQKPGELPPKPHELPQKPGEFPTKPRKFPQNPVKLPQNPLGAPDKTIPENNIRATRWLRRAFESEKIQFLLGCPCRVSCIIHMNQSQGFASFLEFGCIF
jgi:hypothetical protein